MIVLFLPPPYRAVRLAQGERALAAARAAAAAGVEEGALFWGCRADRLDCALVLRPDRSRRETLPVVYVTALAVADALGAVAPPAVPLAFRWPDGILIDGGLAGRVSFACAPCAADAAPEWAVAGFELALAAGEDEPGHSPYLTGIAEEGFGEFSPAGHIEGFARHFLRWLARLEEDGFAPIAAEWWRRASGFVADAALALAGSESAAAIGIDPTGGLRVRQDGREGVVPLETAFGDADDDA